MLTSEGKCVIDAIQVGEVELDLLSSMLVMKAKYILTNQASGVRFGQGNKNMWSEGTINKAKELIAAMEYDIGKEIFFDTLSTKGVIITAPDEIPCL